MLRILLLPQAKTNTETDAVDVKYQEALNSGRTTAKRSHFVPNKVAMVELASRMKTKCFFLLLLHH